LASFAPHPRCPLSYDRYGRNVVIASIEITRMPTYRKAFAFWLQNYRAWRNRSRAQPGRQIVGAQVTFSGNDGIYRPWGPKPRIFPDALRNDGWGWWFDSHRVMVLSAWESREALDAHEQSLVLPAGTERWFARLRPVKVKGTIWGERVLGEFTKTGGTGHKPGLAMTWNRHFLWQAPSFHKWVLKIADDSHESHGAIASMSTGWVFGLPYFSAFTLTFWERLEDMVKFAYKRDVHTGAIDWYGKPPYRFGEPWWGRFVVEESRGTLGGRNPYEGLVLDPDVPERAAATAASA
jgi:hypothetical protein